MAHIRRVTLNNPRLLSWARETAQLSVEELADKMGKSPEVIAAWEAGEAAPTFAQLDQLASYVNRSVAILYLPEPPKEPQLPRDFRRLPGSGAGRFSPAMVLAFRELRNALSDMREVSELLGEHPRLDLPRVQLSRDPGEAGRRIRVALGVTVDQQVRWHDERAALHEWRSTLYDKGVLVQQFSLPVEEMRGFSLLDSGLGGIGISSKDAPAARIFSLAHELGHLCLQAPGVSPDASVIPDRSNAAEAVVERYCESFAAAFLLPDDDTHVQNAMSELATHLTRANAEECAARFKVSKYAVACKLVDMHLLGADVYRETSRRWRDEDLRRPKRDAGPVPPVRRSIGHHGKRFVATIIEALDTAALSRYEAAKMIALQPKHLNDARTAVYR